MSDKQPQLGVAPQMIAESIAVGNERIRALRNGKIEVNGEQVETMEDLENAVNILFRAVLSLAGQQPYIREDADGD
jgi:hypothetical protein